jgi:hypothetical protein
MESCPQPANGARPARIKGQVRGRATDNVLFGKRLAQSGFEIVVLVVRVHPCWMSFSFEAQVFQNLKPDLANFPMRCRTHHEKMLDTKRLPERGAE